ncbi:MAG TPA: hypothetical protein VIH21_08330, partial [Dehalococcoidia bacterium]
MKSRIAVATLALALFALGSAAICGDGSKSGSPASDQKKGSGEWIDAFSDSTFSARYAFTSTGTTGDGFAGSGEMVLYKKGADHVRADVTFNFGDAMPFTGADDATTEMTIIETPDVNAICFGKPGIFAAFGVGRANTCLAPDDFGQSDGYGSVFENLSFDDIDRDEYTETNVKGRNARCYAQPPSPTPTPAPTFESSFDPSDPDSDPLIDTIELTDRGPFGDSACFSREGFLVRITGDDSSGSADAEDLADTVDDNLFDAPYPFFDPPSLEVRNDSDVDVFVNAYASASGTIFDAFSGEGDFPLANENIDAHSSTVLKGNLFGDPLRVEFGTYELPQWAWSCTWDDAKAQEPLVIENDSSNCR